MDVTLPVAVAPVSAFQVTCAGMPTASFVASASAKSASISIRDRSAICMKPLEVLLDDEFDEPDPSEPFEPPFDSLPPEPLFEPPDPLPPAAPTVPFWA